MLLTRKPILIDIYDIIEIDTKPKRLSSENDSYGTITYETSELLEDPPLGKLARLTIEDLNYRIERYRIIRALASPIEVNL